MIIINDGLRTPLVRRLVLASAGLTAFVCGGLYCDWNKSEWASWVQAVGSIAAIYGAFNIARRQYQQGQRADNVRHEREAKYALDNELAARTLAVRNLVQTATLALESARKLIVATKDDEPNWEREQYFEHMDNLRSALDSLIAPNTEHLALLTALSVSKTLTEVKRHLSNVGGAMKETLLIRATASVNDTQAMLDRLIVIQGEMLAICSQREIPVEIDSFRLR